MFKVFTGSGVCRDPPWSQFAFVCFRGPRQPAPPSPAPTPPPPAPPPSPPVNPLRVAAGVPPSPRCCCPRCCSRLFCFTPERADTAQPPRVDWRRIFSFIPDSMYFFFFFFEVKSFSVLMGNVLKGARAAPIGCLYAPVKKTIRFKWLCTNEFCTLDQISRIL